MKHLRALRQLSAGRTPNLPWVLSALLLIASASAFALNYGFALHGWFYREDSRYFSNGLFSPWDVITAFLTPHNSMGHFRPITKLIWGIPQWVGLFDARIYHSLLFATLGLAAILLMRLSFILFGHPLLAVLCGILWALMPTNAKPIYWICAGQDTAAALFIFAAFNFRLDQWRTQKHEQLFRGLCLTCLFFALSSREVGFSAGILLLLIDWRFGRLRKSLDVIAIWAAFTLWVFVLNPPFERAHVSLNAGLFFSGATLRQLWDYALSSLWTLGDADMRIYPWWAIFITVMAFLALLIAPLLHWALLFASLLAMAGIVPFLLINAFSIEYVFLFGAGISLMLTGLPALFLSRRPASNAAQVALFVVGLAAIGSYYEYLRGSRQIFRDNYTSRSIIVRDFLAELKHFTDQLSPYQRIEITDFGPYRMSEVRDSHHLIPPALDELIPERVFLIAPSVLGSGEGTGLKNPNNWVWRGDYNGLPRPARIRYTEKGFALD